MQLVVGRISADHLLIGVVFTAIVMVALPRLLQSPPLIGPDAFVFEYGGLLFAQGHSPYVTIWDVKPPGVYYLTGALALLAGGDPHVLHWLAVGVNAACVCVTLFAVMALVRTLTENVTAARSSAISLATYPALYMLPATGFRPKFAVLALTSTALYWYAAGRWRAALVAAVFAPTFWQPAVVVPVVLAVATFRTDRSSLPSVVGIGTGATVAVVAPVAMLTGLETLMTQTVIAPLAANEPFEPGRHILRGGYYLAFAAPIAFVGGLELLRRVREVRQLWLGVPFCAFAL